MNKSLFYVAAKDSGERGGIYRYCLDAQKGVQLCGFSAQPDANFLLHSSDHKFLYASGGEPADDGFISTYAIGTEGALQKKDEFATPKSNCHLLQVGDFLYASNYRDGSFSEFRLENGVVVEETKRIQHHGSGPVAGRQDAAHVHSCNVTPDGKYLAVVDLGSDMICCYALNKDGVANTPKVVYHSPAGDGPRHMIFSPDGRIAYVVNELANSVSSLQYTDGSFALLKSVSTLPRFFNGATKASAIRFAPTGEFFCTTNRGFDSVALFATDDQGDMKRAFVTLTAGRSPRDGNFVSPQCYAAACEDSDEVIFFDCQDSTLTPNGIRLELPHPLYILPCLGCN